MCPGHEANGEFAGESGNLHREWWRTENLRFSLILQIVENQRSKQGNKKAGRGVHPAKRQKNGGRTLYHFQIKSSSKIDRKLFIYAQIIEFDSIFA